MLANLDSHVHACDRKWHHVMSLMSQGSKHGAILSPQYVTIIEKKSMKIWCFSKRTVSHFGTQVAPFCILLGPSWAHLGATLGPFGAILAPLGVMLGTIWAILGHLGAILGGLRDLLELH